MKEKEPKEAREIKLAEQEKMRNRVALLLPTGKDKAVSRMDLCYRIGVTDRKMRELIHDLRVGGMFICSTKVGYYIPDSIEDVKHQYQRESKRIRNTYAAIKVMRAWLKDQGVEV